MAVDTTVVEVVKAPHARVGYVVNSVFIAISELFIEPYIARCL